jgi:hypothetical protein
LGQNSLLLIQNNSCFYAVFFQEQSSWIL